MLLFPAKPGPFPSRPEPIERRARLGYSATGRKLTATPAARGSRVA